MKRKLLNKRKMALWRNTWMVFRTRWNRDLLTAKGTATIRFTDVSDKAIITAKRELASKIEETLAIKPTVFKGCRDNENSKNYDETIITTISRIDNVELSGFKVDNRKVINLELNRSYIGLVYPIGTANKLLVNKINKEEELKLRLESSEALKNLKKK